jgi:hypothetical protein
MIEEFKEEMSKDENILGKIIKNVAASNSNVILPIKDN